MQHDSPHELDNERAERAVRKEGDLTESGLAWLPFMMQRLDHEYLMRQSDAPRYRGKLPSEHAGHVLHVAADGTDEHETAPGDVRGHHAETQLLFASDWPHWDLTCRASSCRCRF